MKNPPRNGRYPDLAAQRELLPESLLLQENLLQQCLNMPGKAVSENSEHVAGAWFKAVIQLERIAQNQKEGKSYFFCQLFQIITRSMAAEARGGGAGRNTRVFLRESACRWIGLSLDSRPLFGQDEREPDLATRKKGVTFTDGAGMLAVTRSVLCACPPCQQAREFPGVFP